MNPCLRPTLVASAIAALLFAACQTVPGKPPEQANAPVAKAIDDPKADGDAAKHAEALKKSDAQAQLEKDIRNKQRELDFARIGIETVAVDRQIRTLTTENLLQTARIEMEKAKRELDLFVSNTKPHELEEHQMQLDSLAYRFEEQKDEQSELESMYKDDQFAKQTKELVLRRGLRQVELADRALALARKEFKILEERTLPDRERELRRKVETTELEVKKSDLESRKSTMEIDVQRRQAGDKLKDAEQDLKELLQKLAKASA